MPTLIVEDGSIVDNANSYISLAEADAYFEVLLPDAWKSANEEKKTQSLIIATQAVDALYGGEYRSVIRTTVNRPGFRGGCLV